MKKNIAICFLLFSILIYFGGNRAEELDIQVNSVDISAGTNLCKIDIKLDRGADYKLLELKDKKFLIFDILDSVSNLKNANQYINNPFIKMIRSSQYQITPTKIVRLVFELQEMFPYKIEKSDAGFTLILEKEGSEPAANEVLENKEGLVQETNNKVSEDKEKPAQETNNINETEDKGLVTMDFREVDINNVLRMFSYKSGVNIVAGSEVQGKVTLRLSKVPWEQALKTILEINGFTYERTVGNIIRVASIAKIRSDQKSRQEDELDRLKAEEAAKPMIPLNTKTIFVSYAYVEEMKVTVEKLLSERGSIMTDKRTNSMIINDMPDNVRKVEEMIAMLDKRTPQVIIESKLIQIKSDDTKRLGINWGPDGTSGGIKTINPNTKAAIDAGMLPAISGTSNITVGTVIDNFALNAALHAMLDQSTTELLASPKVATLNNEKATIIIGRKVPIRLLDEDGRPVTRLVPVGIKLEVKPHITADNHITMEIKPEVSFIEAQPISKGEIEISTTEAQTIVMVKDSQTAVIGGLIRKDISQTENKVPFLSNIPFLGFFFKNRADSSKKDELLIFVTPHIITDEEMKNDAFLGLKRMEEIDLEKSADEIEKERLEKESKKEGKKRSKVK